MAEFGDGVAQHVIHGAFGDLTPVEVSNGNTKGRRGNYGGVHLVAVTKGHKQIRTPIAVGAGKRGSRVAHRVSDCKRRIAVPMNRDAGGDLPGRVLRHMTSGNEQARIELIVSAESLEKRGIIPEIRTARGDDADRLHTNCSQVMGVPSSILTHAARPITAPSSAGGNPVPGRLMASIS